MLAVGRDPQDIFDEICHIYEERYPNMRASILILKGNQLFHCSAPSLPKEYSQAIDGVTIGPTVASCGTAAFSGKRVIVENIATDSLWEGFKDVALPHGLQACWSEPILGDNEKVLGTFAMYFDQPTSPISSALKEINNASNLVAIIMEKIQEEALLNKLSQATEQSGESIVITDKNGTIEYVNPAFTKITGYTAKEAIGSNPKVLNSENQTNDYYKKLWETITNGDVWHSSIVDKRKDGSEYPALMTVSPIKSNKGETTHYVGIQVDMSEHATLEEQFRQSQKMEALGTLVGGIAHDFNNTLAGITGNLFLAKKKVLDSPDVLEKLKKVEQLSFNAAETVKQLLAFARKDIIQMKPFGLTSFMKEVAKLHESIIPESIKFSESFSREELKINGDANQIQQMLINMLNNARDAVACVEQPKISLTLAEYIADKSFYKNNPEINTPKFAHLIIKDNGCGISEKDKEHVFEPFFTTKAVGSGTGLGLAMAYGAVKSHGGVLYIDSKQDEGTSFHIYFPLVNEVHDEFIDKKDDDIIQGSGELILLVDDNNDVRSTGKDVLESLGYKVIEASDGLNAVEKFTSNQNDIDLVITDVVMPKLGGVEAAARILKIKPEAKVIFSSGYDRDEDLENEMPMTDAIMLPKPFSVIELSKIISGHLGSSKKL